MVSLLQFAFPGLRFYANEEMNAIEFFDPDHSEREDRFVMLGTSFKLRLLVVCHCARETQSVIRIISARKATHREAEQYRRERA